MEDNSLQRNILVRPIITHNEVKKVVSDLYGLKTSTILELNGYDDKNFHISVEREIIGNNYIDEVVDSGYVLKIVNTLDSQNKSYFEAQTSLLFHLGKSSIACPKPIFTKERRAFSTINLSTGSHIIRLLEYIDGEILYKIQAFSQCQLFFQVGTLAAKIDNSLQSFDHPAYHQKIQWSLGSAPDILKYLFAIKDESKKDLIKETILDFSSRVLSIENTLERGIIHGDINEQNLLVEEENGRWKLKAVIDFGDTHYACYLYELALAMAYMIFLSNDLDSGGYVLAGYCSIRNVSEQECELLKICILTRYCQSIVLGAYANLQNPENTYVLTTGTKGLELLEKISSMPEALVLNRWREIAKNKLLQNAK